MAAICALLAWRGTDALGAVRLCLEVEAAESEPQSLRRLIVDELGHHPGHLLVETACTSTLKVQLFKLEGSMYLTARINQQVPVRHQVDDKKDIPVRLRDAISQVLAHDPVFLADDITHYSAVQRAAHSVLNRGHNTFRIELYQGIGRGGNNTAFAPGAALNITRGADNWQVYTRIYFGGWPGNVVGADRALKVSTGADVGLTFEFSARSSSSLYVSAGLGLQYLRYEGRLDPADPGSLDTRNDFGPSAHLRLGLRLLRIYDFDWDVFVTGYLPMFSADVDTRLEDFYPPSLQVGVGVGF